MAAWRKQIFMFLSKNSLDASSFFNLPPNRVVELGAQMEF
jgi:KUP system potassium uptake protein